MRATRTIPLSPGRDATIQEARVVDMRRLFALLPDQPQVDLLGLLSRSLPDLIAILGDCLALPAGETVDGLSLSECEAIGAAWWEMHQGFFQRALAVVGYDLVSAAASPLSTEPV